MSNFHRRRRWKTRRRREERSVVSAADSARPSFEWREMILVHTRGSFRAFSLLFPISVHLRNLIMVSTGEERGSERASAAVSSEEAVLTSSADG